MTVSEYYKAGSFGGSELTPGDWTQLGSDAAVTSLGLDGFTPVDAGAVLLIPSGATFGLYFVINGGAGDVAINYTNGANNVSDGTLALSFGAGVRGLFGVGGGWATGPAFAPRTANVQLDFATPEPCGLVVSPGGRALLLPIRRRLARV